MPIGQTAQADQGRQEWEGWLDVDRETSNDFANVRLRPLDARNRQYAGVSAFRSASKKLYIIFSIYYNLRATGQSQPQKTCSGKARLGVGRDPQTGAAAGLRGSNTGRGRPLCVGGDSSPKPRRIFVAS